MSEYAVYREHESSDPVVLRRRFKTKRAAQTWAANHATSHGRVWVGPFTLPVSDADRKDQP